MDLQAIRAFISVARCGSFSTAAEQLYITQPAVSKRIASLEKQIGAKLFDRLGHQIILTASGEALMPHATQMLNALEDGRRAIEQLSNEVSGTLKVSASHHVGLHYLPPILKRFINAYSEVDLNLDFIDSEQAWKETLQGSRELAIVTLPTGPIDNLHCIPIWHDPLTPMLAADHTLDVRQPVSLTTLSQIPAILPAHGTMTRAIIDQALKHKTEQVKNPELSTHFLETIKMMVSVGLGWSILPESMLDHSIQRFEIRGMKSAVRHLGIVHHSDRTLSKAATALIELISDNGKMQQGQG